MGFFHSSRRKLISWNSKSMAVISPRKSTLPEVFLKRLSQSPPLLLTTRTSTALVSPKVMVEKASPHDGVPRNFPGKPTEVSGKSLVSVLGIQQGYPLLSPGVAKKVITTVLRSTKKSTDSVPVTKPKTVKSTKTTLPPKPTGPINLSTQSVDSPTTVRSKTTFWCSKVPAWVAERDPSCLGNLSSTTTRGRISRRSL